MRTLLLVTLLGSTLFANENLLGDLASAPNAKAIHVLDTDSAIGRLNIHPKSLDLETLVRAHGHLCDGLSIAYVELSAVLKKLFPDGKVDRTDLRVVSKNSPCLVDASSLMTGARINFKTLSLDNDLGLSFIVQKISTGETYEVSLQEGVMDAEYKAFEKGIRDRRKAGKAVSAKDIDTFEKMTDALVKKVLYSKPDTIVTIKPLKGYHFHFSTEDFGVRSDIINRDMPR